LNQEALKAEPRQGTLMRGTYKAIRDALPGCARIALVIAYHTGARKGELRQIRKDQIDFKAMRINLPGHTTKNKRPRFLPIYGDMGPELEMAIAAGARDCSYVIQHEGKAVHDREKAWVTACSVAGAPGTLFHDLRRTALTNMIEAGLQRRRQWKSAGTARERCSIAITSSVTAE